MSIRIDIEWEFLSPAAGIASGILTLNKMYHSTSHSARQPEVILKCRCKRVHGSIGFEGIDEEGYSSEIFKQYEEQIKLMVDSYFGGMLLQKYQFHWVESTLKNYGERDEDEITNKKSFR